MKKKKGTKTPAMAPEADCPREEVDTRPNTSPYTASSTLKLEDGSQFTLPSSLLDKYPKLKPISTSPWGETVRLKVPRDIAHIFVHYLLTGTYQCLKPTGSSHHVKLIAEFMTSIQAYVLAREFDISPVEDLAKGEIQRLGEGLSFGTVIDVTRSVYPEPSADDTWFSEYLKSGLESIFRKPSDLLDCDISNTRHKTWSVGDLLFKNLAELVRDQLITLPHIDGAPEAGVVEALALVMPAPEHESLKEETLQLDDSSFVVPSGSVTTEVEPELPESQPYEDIVEADPTLTTIEPEPEPVPKPENAIVDKIEDWACPSTLVEDMKTAEAEPEIQIDDDCWGLPSSKSKKKKKTTTWNFEPETVPEPAPESKEKTVDDNWNGDIKPTEPESEEKIDDDFWGFSKSSDKKKKKTRTTDVEPELEPEPVKNENDDPWAFLSSPKKNIALEATPKPEPDMDKNGDDFCSSLPVSKKDLKKKKKEEKKHRELEPEQDNVVQSPPETVSNAKGDVPEESAQQVIEVSPAVTDDWSLCTPIGKNYRPEAACIDQAEHVLGGGWKQCSICQGFIRRLSQQLPPDGN